MNLTQLSIERPSIISVIFIVLLFLGSLSYFSLSYELVPKFTPGVIAVVTAYPGASPPEVESAVTLPIEDALSSLENLDDIRSMSQENLSIVRAYLTSEKGIDNLMMEAQRRVNAIKNQLPSNIREPTVSKFDVNDFPIIRMGAFSNLEPQAFYDLAKNNIQTALSNVKGVARVTVVGGTPREVRVSVDPKKLRAYRVSLLQVLQAIGAANVDIPAGKIEGGGMQQSIRLTGKFTSPKEIEELEVAKNFLGGAIKLKDIAVVVDTLKAASVISRVNGVPALGIDIQKRRDANTVEVSRAVQNVLADLELTYQQQGLTFDITQDSSEFTLKAANAVREDLFLAVLLVSMVMLLFLHSLRNSLIVLVSIPTSIISTFTVMYLLGYSLNMMTLLGLSLAIGILVDDSIVVIENIYRHLEMGKSRVKAAYEGRMEIGFTAISITLIDVVVFLPLVFASGLVADLFRPFSVVIVTSTLLSLFVSFTLVPFLGSRFGKLERLSSQTWLGKGVDHFEKTIDKFIGFILNLLQWAFRHKGATLAMAFSLLLLSGLLIPMGFIGVDFLQAGDRGEFVLELELPKTTPLERTDQVAYRAEQLVNSLPGVRAVFTTVGLTSSSRIQLDVNHVAELSVKLVDKGQRKLSTAQLARKAKLMLEAQLVGTKVGPVEINLLGLRDDGPVEMILYGEDEDELFAYSRRVVDILDSLTGAIEVKSSVESSAPELKIRVDREKLASLGLNLGQVGMVLRTAFAGNNEAKFRDREATYDINVSLSDFDRRSVKDIQELTVLNPTGGQIPIKQFSTITSAVSPSTLERTNRQRSVNIKSQVAGRSAGSLANQLQGILEESGIPAGISFEFTGNIERQRESFITLGIAFGISILFVYLVMVALYDSYVYPFVVLFSIPMALIGAFLLLGLTKSALTIFSVLGLIMLVGLVGKNAILVVDFTNRLREQGMDLKEALFEATRLRFRPILMTNISMVIGLLPIALASGAGSEWKNGLAWALIGGLSSSMFLSLIVVPVVYHLLDTRLEKMGWRQKEKVRIGTFIEE